MLISDWQNSTSERSLQQSRRGSNSTSAGSAGGGLQLSTIHPTAKLVFPEFITRRRQWRNGSYLFKRQMHWSRVRVFISSFLFHFLTYLSPHNSCTAAALPCFEWPDDLLTLTSLLWLVTTSLQPALMSMDQAVLSVFFGHGVNEQSFKKIRPFYNACKSIPNVLLSLNTKWYDSWL